MKPLPACPRCGTSSGAFIKNFCLRCFLEAHKVLEAPKQLAMEHCRRCGKIKLLGKWQQQDAPIIEDFLSKKIKTKELQDAKIKISLQPLGNNSTIAKIGAEGKIAKQHVSVSAETILVPKEILCETCMRISAQYHEAVIQLRFSKEKEQNAGRVLEALEQKIAALASEDVLSIAVNVLKRENGFDVLVAGKRAAKTAAKYIAHKFGMEIKKSSSSAGRGKNGRERKRFTYCLRI